MMTQAELVAAYINGLLQILICNTQRLKYPGTGEPLTLDLITEKTAGLFQPDYSQEKLDWMLKLGHEIADDDQLWQELPDLLVNNADDEGQRFALIQTNQRMISQGLRPLDLTTVFNQMRSPKEEYRIKLRQGLATLDKPAG